MVASNAFASRDRGGGRSALKPGAVRISESTMERCRILGVVDGRSSVRLRRVSKASCRLLSAWPQLLGQTRVQISDAVRRLAERPDQVLPQAAEAERDAAIALDHDSSGWP